MNADTLLENFEILAEATDGINQIRELILNLAVDGKLVSRVKTDGVLKSGIEGPFQLPGSWRWELLTSITTDLGQEVPKSEFQYIDVGSINSKAGRVSEEISLLKPDDAPSRARKLVKKGTVLYSTVRPYLRNIAIVEKDFDPKAIASTAFAVLHPSDQILSSYLFVCVRSSYFTQFVESKQKGVAYPAINAGDLKLALIPLPPIGEQQEIIVKVDELMALCDQLEQQQKRRDNIRTATRKSAIDAISTATTPEELEAAWKRINNNWEVIADSLASVDHLKKLILANAASGTFLLNGPRTNFAGLRQTLGELCEIYQPKTISTRELIENGMHLVYGANGVIGRYDKFNHEFEEVLVTCRGATCGAVNVSVPKSWINGNAMVVRPKSNGLSKDYLAMILRGIDYASVITGTAQPQITRQPLSKISIFVPSVAEQKQIVAKVDELMALCYQLEVKLNDRNQVAEKFARSVVSAA